MLNVLLLILIFLANTRHAFGADPVYTDPTISDSAGNSADQSGTINWADLPAGTSYNAGNPSRISEGLTAYYDFMRSFVNSVFPKDLPDTLVENVVNGTYDKVISDYRDYVTFFLGYAICVAVGILFFFIFPIVAICFCCCRICGNCGGRMRQDPKDAKNKCKRNTFAVLLAVMLAFSTVGMICVFLNNQNTSTAINGIASTGRDNLDDIKLFVNNTVDEAKHIARNNYEFLKKALNRDIDNIGYLVGIPLRTNIETETNIRNTLTLAYSLNDDLTTADTRLADVNTKVGELNASLVELDTALSAVKTNLDNAFAACGGICPAAGKPEYESGTSVGVDPNQLPDLSTQTQDMNDATNQNLTEQVGKAENDLDDIPWNVVNDSETSRNDMKTSIDNLSDDIDPMMDKIDNLENTIYGDNATVNLEEYEDKLTEYGDLAAKYDKYRWYGGIGLSCIILLIILLGMLGLIFGIIGCNSEVDPSDRGCLSNSGGNCLIASAAFIFIFSALLMLLTTLTFILGAPMERFVCKTITDPSLSQMEKWIDGTYNKKSVGDGKYFLGDTLYSNSAIPLTLTGILRDCKANKAAFEAFQLSSQFDLTDILNYSKTLDVDSEIDQVNVDLSGVEVFPASLKTQMDDLKAAVNISFQEFYDELNNSPTNQSLAALADDLDSYASGTGDTTFQNAVSVETAELRRIESEEVVYVVGNITALNNSVKAMEDAVSGLPASIDSIESGLTTTEQYIQNNGSDVVKSLLKDSYASRLTGIADSYVAYTENAVKNQLGSCSPIWNVYNSFLVYTFCYNLMDTFNGFWFSLGWCIFFFIPGLIFSIKLAKYFRRMDPLPDDLPQKSDRPLPPTPEVFDNNHKPMFQLRKNKVAHSDGTGCSTDNGSTDESSQTHTTNENISNATLSDEKDPEHDGTDSDYHTLTKSKSDPEYKNTRESCTQTDCENVAYTINEKEINAGTNTDPYYLNETASRQVTNEDYTNTATTAVNNTNSNGMQSNLTANAMKNALEMQTNTDQKGANVKTELEELKNFVVKVSLPIDKIMKTN